MLLGILLLSRPVIEITTKFLQPASVTLLVDKSASMSLSQAGMDRVTQVNKLLTGKAFTTLRERYNLSMYSFSDTLIDLNESDILESPDGIGTDIAGAFSHAIELHSDDAPSALIIISDGAHNSGPDPVRLAGRSASPIWTVGVGSSDRSKDLIIVDIISNRLVYRGSKTTVEVKLRAVQAEGQYFRIKIREASGKVIGNSQKSIVSSFDEQTVTMDIIVSAEGRQRFTVEVSPIDNESINENNYRSFYLNVLPGKMKLLIMAGPPDNGLDDLVRHLKGDKHVEPIVRTTLKSGFYEGDWLDASMLQSVDAVILHHFPVKSNDNNKIRSFTTHLEQFNLPICFVDGKGVDSRKLKLITDILPISVNSGRAGLNTAQVIPVKRHALIAAPEDNDFELTWSKLPPLTFLQNRYQADPQASILAEFQHVGTRKRFPAIVASEYGSHKSACILVRDLWLWGLNEPKEQFTGQFFERLTRWLAIRKSNKKLNIQFEKEIFSSRETVSFTATLIDEAFQPVDNAQIVGEVSLNDESGGSVTVEPMGRGRYKGIFQPWEHGEYSLKLNAFVDNELFDSESKEVIVEPYNIELLDSRLNEELLKGIAGTSGGGYVTIGRVDSLFDSFNFAPSEKSETERFELWGKSWLLITIISLLSLEWFIRVRVGML